MTTGTETANRKDETMKTGPTFWIRGDLARYTGKSEVLSGVMMCYEYIFIEGHRKGNLCWTYTAPKQKGGAR